jgi:hypothetical protein
MKIYELRIILQFVVGKTKRRMDAQISVKYNNTKE